MRTANAHAHAHAHAHWHPPCSVLFVHFNLINIWPVFGCWCWVLAALSHALFGGAYFPRCGTAHPRKTMVALKKEAERHGVIIHESTLVRIVERTSATSEREGGGGRDGQGAWHVAGPVLAHRGDIDHLDDVNSKNSQREWRHATAKNVVIASGGQTEVGNTVSTPFHAMHTCLTLHAAACYWISSGDKTKETPCQPSHNLPLTPTASA